MGTQNKEISFKHDVVTGLTFSFDLSSRSHQLKIKLYGDGYSYGEVKAENKIYIDSMDLARPSRFLLPLISNKRSGQEAGKILLELSISTPKPNEQQGSGSTNGSSVSNSNSAGWETPTSLMKRKASHVGNGSAVTMVTTTKRSPKHQEVNNNRNNQQASGVRYYNDSVPEAALRELSNNKRRSSKSNYSKISITAVESPQQRNPALKKFTIPTIEVSDSETTEREVRRSKSASRLRPTAGQSSRQSVDSGIGRSRTPSSYGTTTPYHQDSQDSLDINRSNSVTAGTKQHYGNIRRARSLNIGAKGSANSRDPTPERRAGSAAFVGNTLSSSHKKKSNSITKLFRKKKKVKTNKPDIAELHRVVENMTRDESNFNSPLSENSGGSFKRGRSIRALLSGGKKRR